MSSFHSFESFAVFFPVIAKSRAEQSKRACGSGLITDFRLEVVIKINFCFLFYCC